MLKIIIASAILAFTAILPVCAAPINYSYFGQVSATIVGGTTYAGTGELVGQADTSTVTLISPGSRYNVLSSLKIVIPGVFTATVLGPTYAFSADDAFGFGLGNLNSGTDFADSFPPNYANYDLATNYGPVLITRSNVSGTSLTDAGRINLLITSPRLVATVPEPTTFPLLLAVLAAATTLRCFGNLQRDNQAATRSGLNLA